MDLRTKEQWQESIPDAHDAPEDTARWTAALRALLRGSDIDDLDDGSLDLLERSALALVGAIHTERLRRKGWESRAWGMAAPAELSESSPTWRDHPYTLVHREREVLLFCAEPYELAGEGLLALAALVVAGWDVHVDAGSAVHFPGRTLRVSLSRPRRSSAEEGQRWHWPEEAGSLAEQ
jgi:hypothetical protein